MTRLARLGPGGQVVDLRDLPPWATGGDDGDYETMKFPGVGEES